MCEIRMAEIGTCLKSKLLCVHFLDSKGVWYPNKIVQISDVTQQGLKSELFGNWTFIEYLKSILAWISDTYYILISDCFYV